LPGDRQIHNDLKQIYVLGVLGRITSFAAKWIRRRSCWNRMERISMGLNVSLVLSY
jgi:hypothetical protein